MSCKNCYDDEYECEECRSQENDFIHDQIKDRKAEIDWERKQNAY